MVDVGQRLRALRRDREWSQAQVATLVREQCGLNWFQSTVQKIEAGRELTLTEIEALSDVFGLPFHELLYGDMIERPDYGDYPPPDPAEVMADRVRDAQIASLRTERQAHILRLAEIDAELARLNEPRGGLPPADH